jgi:CRP-like cAMP-binding protein
MPDRRNSVTKSNRILERLSAEDLRLLLPDLAAVDLPLRKELETPHKPIEHVYFIDSGFASVVANGKGDRNIEVGLIGREGVTGLAVIMETDRSPNKTFVQGVGKGRRISSANLRRAMLQSATLRRALLHFAHAFFVQTSQTALANGRGKLEQRLARWLCMAHDRSDGDELSLTHEFLSVMLGVRRTGVTLTLAILENAGFIQLKRRVIVIVDRKGLEQSSDGAYGAPEAEFQRLFG